MGLQRYRADTQGQADAHGAIPWYTKWMGGPSLALIRNCPVKVGDVDLPKRTVYIIRLEADTYFSIPAACSFKGKTIYGWVGQEDGNYFFRANKKVSP